MYGIDPRAEVGGRTRAKSGEVEGGGRRAEGGHWADHEGLWRTEDGEKFLLRFSTADILTHIILSKSFQVLIKFKYLNI